MKKTLKKTWENPVKGKPPKESTMNTPGDFGRFTETMRKLVKTRPEKKSASLGPAVS